MATQKRTIKSTTPKRTASTRVRRGTRRVAPKKQPIRREVGGVFCLLLALFVGIGYFQHDALLIRWLYLFCRGMTGWGWYAALTSLLLSTWILLLHRGRSVISHVTGALLIPVVLGALLHVTSNAQVIPSGFAAPGKFTALWESGVTLTSGGVLSGALAVGLTAVIGKIGALLVLIFALVGCLMAALRLSPAAVVDAVRNHEFAPYDNEPEDDVLEKRPSLPKNTSVHSVHTAKAKSDIDIPLDEPVPQKESTPAFSGGRIGFFSKKPAHIRTPDQLLEESDKAPTIPTEPTSETEAVKTDEPLRLDPIAPPSPPEPKAEKLTGEDVQQATAEVTAEIEAAQETTSEYRYPPITLLQQGATENAGIAGTELRFTARRLAETLKSFGVEAVPGDVVRGPSVTRYEFTLEKGVKLSKITNLQDDIALALGAVGVRIAPIPDKLSVVGIEVPNKLVTAVHIRNVLTSRAFAEHKSNVCFCVGKDINGRPIIGDIARFPHVLIAGTTGSGKSVCTNSLIVSLLYKSTPEEVRFIMVDPKMVELAPYNGIPHLLIPVVTDPKKAAGALQWAVYEMMKRYQLFSNHGVKDLASYNKLAETDPEMRKFPTVVVVIDELADLMLVAAKEVEESICRVAQMGRAAGMHLVIATQRPSADVITGLMKANIPSRIAFAVASSLESRIILDNTGAEKLVGKGDMLYAPLGEGKPCRVQGCFISPEEIESVVEYVKQNGGASYDRDVIERIEQTVAEKERSAKGAMSESESTVDKADEMLDAAIDVVMETGQASTSLLQRRLKLGYSRAARIVDQMEERGIVGPFEGSKPRALLITKEQWQALKRKEQDAAVSDPKVETTDEDHGD